MSNRVLISIYVVILAVLFLMYPDPVDWSPSYDIEDRIPRGASIFNEWLVSEYGEENIYYSMENWSSEQSFEEPEGSVWLFVQRDFKPSPGEWETIDSFCSAGGIVFASANSISFGYQKDSLKIFTNFARNFIRPNVVTKDTSTFRLTLSLGGGKEYIGRINNNLARNYITSNPDSLIRYDILSWGDQGPVMIRVPLGEGFFYFHCVPDVFTNYALLYEDIHAYVEGLMSLMPKEHIILDQDYNEKISAGSSPLRVMLRNPALKWMYYILLSGLLVFAVFGLKRRSRPVPVIEPNKNMSVEFANSLAGMYYHKSSWTDIVKMRFEALVEYLRSNHYMTDFNFDEEGAEVFSSRTGFSLMESKALFKAMNQRIGDIDTFNEVNTIINNCYQYLKTKKDV